MGNIIQTIKQNIWLWLLFSAIILVAAIAGNKLWTMDHAFESARAAPLGQFIGAEDAPEDRIIVEFMDYRCHACRNSHKITKALIEKYPDVKIVFRHLPVFLEPSIREARLALAAGKQGKFAEMHEQLITRNAPVQDSEIRKLAAKTGLDHKKLTQDMLDDDITDTILETLDLAKILKVGVTPTFVIGNIVYAPIDHPITVEDFERLLSEVANK